MNNENINDIHYFRELSAFMEADHKECICDENLVLLAPVDMLAQIVTHGEAFDMETLAPLEEDGLIELECCHKAAEEFARKVLRGEGDDGTLKNAILLRWRGLNLFLLAKLLGCIKGNDQPDMVTVTEKGEELGLVYGWANNELGLHCPAEHFQELQVRLRTERACA